MLHFSDVLSRSFSMYTMNSDAYGCGRPQGGGFAKCGQMRTGGGGGVKNGLFFADVLYGRPHSSASSILSLLAFILRRLQIDQHCFTMLATCRYDYSVADVVLMGPLAAHV